MDEEGGELTRSIKGPWTGGCQCGAVRFTVPALTEPGHLCHCRMCQKASGNLFAALVGVVRDEIVWHGAPSGWHSSATVRRLFCPTCGTPLGYAGDEDDGWGLMIGAFDRAGEVPVDRQCDIYARHPAMDVLDLPHGNEPPDDPRGATSRQHPDGPR